MKNKWWTWIILGIILAVITISFFLNTLESNSIRDLKKYSVNLVKCYSLCPITREQSLTDSEKILDHINYSCKKQCDAESELITNGDIIDMNLSRKESNELLEMLKEYHQCIQKTDEVEIHSCFNGFIEEYS